MERTVRFLWAAAFLVTPLAAQPPHIYRDLSGSWLRTEAGQPPRPYLLPRTAVAQDGKFRLEREVELPGDGLEGLAILMTPIGGSFEIRINHQPIGGLKPAHPLLAPAIRNVVLPVPEGVLHAGVNLVTVDVEPTGLLNGLSGRQIRHGGPLLGGVAELESIAEGRQRARELRFIYLPINTVMELLFCVMLLGLTRGSRYRAALRWMAGYFAITVICNDLPLSTEIFAGQSPTLTAWLNPITRFGTTAALLEASLALVSLALPVWSRLVFYGAIGASAPFTNLYQLVLLTVNAALLWLAARRANRIAVRFQSLLVGYFVVTVAAFPPLSVFGPTLGFTLGPVTFAVVPGYRILIGIGLILLIIWQSVRDRNERERLAGELEAARAVQQMMIEGGVQGVDAVYHPAAEVGGDFWQAYALADGERLVVVGDVSGKGLRAAMLVSLITGMLDRRSTNFPAAVLTELNAALCPRLRGGFVTCCVARVGANGQAVIANAGHPAPYADGREVELTSGLPLGLTRDAEYSESVVHYEQQLSLVSDGVVEAEDAERELFGFDRTREISRKPASEIAEAAKAWGQNDDITVVTVRRSG